MYKNQRGMCKKRETKNVEKRKKAKYDLVTENLAIKESSLTRSEWKVILSFVALSLPTR